MIAFQIKSITKSTPIKPGSSADRHKEGEGQAFVGSSGQQGNLGEKGTAFVKVKVVTSGELESIEDIFILGDFPMKATCLKSKKTLFGSTELELYFDQIFYDGFRDSIEEILTDSPGMIGLSRTESASMDKLETQRNLFNLLADLLVPAKKEAIKSLVLPCFILRALDNQHADASYFMGKPMLPHDKKMPKNAENEPLFHLATLKAEQIQNMFGQYSKFELLPHLSFYIDIENTENGWPEEASRFKVFNYAEAKTAKNSSEYEEPAHKIVFEESMDIPKYDHAIFRKIGLTAEEMEQYEHVYEAFRELRGQEEEEEKNKIFGYPDSVQGCVAYEAERLKMKKDFSDETYRDAADWQLLLQISPYAQEFDFFEAFGDGAIYYMIRKKDLQAGNFEDIQLVVQST